MSEFFITPSPEPTHTSLPEPTSTSLFELTNTALLEPTNTSLPELELLISPNTSLPEPELLISPRYAVNIDFADASHQWRANKRLRTRTTFEYCCGLPKANGDACQAPPHHWKHSVNLRRDFPREWGPCTFHYHQEQRLKPESLSLSHSGEPHP